MFKLLAWFSLFVVAVNAGYYVLPYEEKPKGRFDNIDGCYLSKFDTVIPADVDSYPSPSCESYSCSSESGYITFVSTCATYYFEDPTCSLVDGDSSQVYPDCCPYPYCTNPNAVYTAVA